MRDVIDSNEVWLSLAVVPVSEGAEVSEGAGTRPARTVFVVAASESGVRFREAGELHVMRRDDFLMVFRRAPKQEASEGKTGLARTMRGRVHQGSRVLR